MSNKLTGVLGAIVAVAARPGCGRNAMRETGAHFITRKRRQASGGRHAGLSKRYDGPRDKDRKRPKVTRKMVWEATLRAKGKV